MIEEENKKKVMAFLQSKIDMWDAQLQRAIIEKAKYKNSRKYYRNISERAKMCEKMINHYKELMERQINESSLPSESI